MQNKLNLLINYLNTFFVICFGMITILLNWNYVKLNSSDTYI